MNLTGSILPQVQTLMIINAKGISNDLAASFGRPSNICSMNLTIHRRPDCLGWKATVLTNLFIYCWSSALGIIAPPLHAEIFHKGLKYQEYATILIDIEWIPTNSFLNILVQDRLSRASVLQNNESDARSTLTIQRSPLKDISVSCILCARLPLYAKPLL